MEQGSSTVARAGSNARLDSLHRRTHRLRTLGMALGVLPVLVVLDEIDAGWMPWAWVLFCGLAWPQLAYLHAQCSRDPFAAELRNFMVDSAMVGTLIPLMQFNLLPSVALLAVTTADKLNFGVRDLWWRSLIGVAICLALTATLTGFAVRPASSMAVVLATLPIMVIHTLAVSLSSYRLIRRVQRQNLQLDELNRQDTLTGLGSRKHWQEQVAALLHRHHSQQQAATLLLVDVDHFKSINDRHGHAVGDDVLRGIAGVIRDAMPQGSHAGRLGGDEFALAVPVAADAARQVAEGIRNGVDALAFAGLPALRCSVSIGLAEPQPADADLRGWMEAADHALYRAKSAGRNRVSIHAQATFAQP